MQTLVVLGATGTVGRNTLDVVQRHPDRLQVFALTAAQDVEGMLSLCATHRPRHVAMLDGSAAETLRGRLQAAGISTEVHAGMDAIAQLAAHPDVDQVMSAIVGAAGLVPTLAAVRAGKRVLIANKEPLVMAGSLLLAEVQRHAATLIPIDSEHNAIFQCLPADSRCGETPRGVRRLILTASGGPFREWLQAALEAVTPEQAVRHPNWVMGPKISVDSATMMNKGLELIEAACLYRLGADALSVVIHPESVIHSVVEYVDGSMLAQMGASDMRVPIAHALAWPQRWGSGVDGLDLAALGQLRFEAVDPGRFPCLDLARQALQQGGHAPNVLNAANEVAVAAFLAGRLRFTAIAPLIGGVLARMGSENFGADDELASILAVDAWARRGAMEALPNA